MPSAFPAIRPSGAGFPVFNGNPLSIQSSPLTSKSRDTSAINVQFDFAQMYYYLGQAGSNQWYESQDGSGNNYLSFIVDPAVVFGTMSGFRAKRVIGAIDFCPLYNQVGPYTPLVIADNKTADLKYIGLDQFDAASLATSGGKCSFCLPLVSMNDSAFLVTKRAESAHVYHGAGSVIFTTEVIDTFVHRCLM